MKQSLHILTLSMILNTGLIATASAQDYSSMSTEDMVQLRSQVRYMSTNDRAAYRTELQSREQKMSREEKNLYRNMNALGGGAGSDAGRRRGKGKGNRDGSGGGGGRGHGHGH